MAAKSSRHHGRRVQNHRHFFSGLRAGWSIEICATTKPADAPQAVLFALAKRRLDGGSGIGGRDFPKTEPDILRD